VVPLFESDKLRHNLGFVGIEQLTVLLCVKFLKITMSVTDVFCVICRHFWQKVN